MNWKVLASLILACALRANGGAFTFTDQPWMGRIGPVVEDITTELRAYWSFDTATVTGITVADQTAYGNTATMRNGANEELRAYWSFDTATVSGSSVSDLTTNGNTATLNGGASIVAGYFAEALQLSAAGSNYVSATNSNGSLFLSNDVVTIACWVKIIAWPGAGKYPMLVGKGHPAYGYAIYLNGDDNKIYGIVGTSGSDTITVSYSIATNAWVHLACVHHSGSVNKIKLYANGVEISPLGNNRGTLANSADDLIMGRHYSNPDVYGYLDALLDEVRIYNRALSAAEISAMAGWSSGDIATVTNLPAIVSGHRNEAVKLEAGKVQWLDATNSNGSLFLSNNVTTIACWVKIIAWPATNCVPIIAGKGDNGIGYSLYLDGNDHLIRGLVGSVGYNAASAGGSLTTNTWNHVAVTSDGLSLLKLFTNGVEVLPRAAGTGGIDNTTNNFTMGRHFYDPVSYGYLDALLDEVRVYNRTLTPAQIAVLAAQ